MNIKNPVFTLLLLTFTFSFVTCCKVGEDGPTNPTNGLTTAVFNPKLKYGSLADIDGNVYKTIKIGTQTWMAENLRVTHYRNGDPIPNVTDTAQWVDLTYGAYCYYNNTQKLDSIATFGGLYNWFAVSDPRGLAPKGWHVPTDEDWKTLITFLGDGDLTLGNSIAGDKMKEAGGKHWSPSEEDNSSGFTALPGGWRNYRTGDFEFIRLYGNWWSAKGDYYAYFFSLSLDPNVFWARNYPQYGYSIRCIKD